MREAHRGQPTARAGRAQVSHAASHTPKSANGRADDDLDELPTLPFNGAHLRDALKARIAVPTSPPLVPTRDSIPPPMILAEEPMPVDPLIDSVLHLQTGNVRYAVDPVVLLDTPSSGSRSVEPRAYRRAPRAVPAGAVDLRHPPRARNPALGGPPARVESSSARAPVVESSAPPAAGEVPIAELFMSAQSVSALFAPGPSQLPAAQRAVIKLSVGELVVPAYAPAAAGMSPTMLRLARSERRTTLLMLTGIGTLLISLMALIR
ncbi:MAG: hypothetical protein ACI9U2_002541 [Bradymonadia bacterium]|jgi:hypothetical protein